MVHRLAARAGRGCGRGGTMLHVRRLSKDERRVLKVQDQVASARQLYGWGFDAATLSRRVASGQWQRIFHGVYVLHSGPVPWRARARAALLRAGPDAALSHDAAAYLQRIVPNAPRALAVSVPAARSFVAPGVRVYRRRAMPFVLRSALARTAPAETTLDLLDLARSPDAAVGLLTDAVRADVHPRDILRAAAGRARVRYRALLEEIFVAGDGAVESALEYRYQRDVERRHRLPAAQLQVRQVLDGMLIRADAIYVGFATRVELDGQLAHPGGRTNEDTWRDNLALLEHSEVTLRYRWFHVAVTPCATSAQVLTSLRRGGFTDPSHPCSPTCDIAVRGL